MKIDIHIPAYSTSQLDDAKRLLHEKLLSEDEGTVTPQSVALAGRILDRTSDFISVQAERFNTGSYCASTVRAADLYDELESSNKLDETPASVYFKQCTFCTVGALWFNILTIAEEDGNYKFVKIAGRSLDLEAYWNAFKYCTGTQDYVRAFRIVRVALRVSLAVLLKDNPVVDLVIAQKFGSNDGAMALSTKSVESINDHMMSSDDLPTWFSRSAHLLEEVDCTAFAVPVTAVPVTAE